MMELVQFCGTCRFVYIDLKYFLKNISHKQFAGSRRDKGSVSTLVKEWI
jgi:hypothetical protein